MRFTAHVDLIVVLEDGNVRSAIEALTALGYRPRPPVPLVQFADASARRRWVTEKGLTVFSLHSPQHPMTEVDLFVEPPLDFDTAFQSRLQVNVASGVLATFVGYNDLLRLKRRAGRAQDLIDLDQLRIIRKQAEAMIHTNSDGDLGRDRGWHEHKVRQLVRMARMPFADKLDWLENAHALAESIRPSKNSTPRDIRTSQSADENR